jgi:hypothetical protein
MPDSENLGKRARSEPGSPEIAFTFQEKREFFEKNLQLGHRRPLASDDNGTSVIRPTPVQVPPPLENATMSRSDPELPQQKDSKSSHQTRSSIDPNELKNVVRSRAAVIPRKKVVADIGEATHDASDEEQDFAPLVHEEPQNPGRQTQTQIAKQKHRVNRTFVNIEQKLSHTESGPAEPRTPASIPENESKSLSPKISDKKIYEDTVIDNEVRQRRLLPGPRNPVVDEMTAVMQEPIDMQNPVGQSSPTNENGGICPSCVVM